jgi:6-phosphogluconolactonase
MNDNLQNMTLYIASSGESDVGIYQVNLHLPTGKLTPISEMTAVSHTQYLAKHPSGHFLNATGPSKNGNVYAFQVDSSTGELSYLNQQPCVDNSPCYVSIDYSGRYIFVINYSGENGCGSVCVFPIHENGEVGVMSDYLRHSGSSIHPGKQKCSHPHSILPDPLNRHVLVQDVGIDAIMVYQLDLESGKLNYNTRIDIASGSGPRHLTFHPTLPTMYVVNELNATITVIDTDWDGIIFRETQTIDTLPANHESQLKPYPYKPESGSYRRPHPTDDDSVLLNTINRTADIHITLDGQYLYSSNRGHNSLAIFRIDQMTGQLESLGHQSSLGDWPRGFAIDPTGQFLIVGNQWSDDVYTLQIDSETGLLNPTGHSLSVTEPLCILPMLDA